jgi:hypothetical protein
MPNDPARKFKPQVSQGILVTNGAVEAITWTNTTTVHGTAPDTFSGYDIPTSLTHSWTGKTVAGVELEITMNLGTLWRGLMLGLTRLLDKIDVLAELPYLLRKVIQAFISAPYVYQWYH